MIIEQSGTARSLATVQLPTPPGTFCAWDSVCVLKFMQDIIGNTALIKACRHGHIETAKVLLDYGANVEHQNNVSIRSQKVWVHKCCLNWLCLFPDNVSDEFCILQYGETALILACFNGKSETVRLLLIAGAKTDTLNKVASYS